MYIIGYIHVCQRGDWRRSFKMLINAVKQSQLYDNVNIIRIGIVNDSGKIINDPLLQDGKFELMYLGSSAQYERPTLLHMRTRANTDPSDTVYFYLHTKGIKHFGFRGEVNVIGWINLMLFWNIFRWQYATTALKTYNIYGCDYNGDHFSGNFWWATSKHIQRLPKQIESYYIAPERWVTIIKDKLYCAYCSEYAGGGLYNNYLDPKTYMHLSNTDAYKTNLAMQKRRIDRQNAKMYTLNKYNNMVGTIMNNKTTTDNNLSTLSNVSKPSTPINVTTLNKAITMSNINKINTVNKSSTMSNLTTVNKSSTMSNINTVNKSSTMSNLTTVNKSSTMSNINNVNKSSTMSNLTKVNKSSTMSNVHKSSTLTNKKSKFTLSNLINK